MNIFVLIIGVFFCTFLINRRKSDFILKSLCYLFLLTVTVPSFFYLSVLNIDFPFKVTNEEYFQAFNYITFSFFLLILLYKLFGKIFPCKIKKSRPIGIKYENRSFYLFILFFIAKLSFYFFFSLKPGDDIDTDITNPFNFYTNILFYFSAIFSSYSFIALYQFIILKKKYYVIMIILMESVYYLYFTGSKSGVSIFLGISFLMYNILNYVPIYKKILFVIILMVVTIPYFYLKSFERQLSRAKDFRNVDKSELVSNISGNNNISLLILPIVYRLDVVSTLSKTITYYRNRDFDYYFYWGQLKNTYIPRFLYPEKGWSSSHGIFVTENILGLSYFTHAAVNPYIEGYIFFGDLGVLIVLLFYVLILIIMRNIFLSDYNDFFKMGFFFSNFMNLINCSNVLTLPKQLLLNYFTFLLLYLIFNIPRKYNFI